MPTPLVGLPTYVGKEMTEPPVEPGKSHPAGPLKGARRRK